MKRLNDEEIGALRITPLQGGGSFRLSDKGYYRAISQAEQKNTLERVISDLLILIGNTTLKSGEEVGRKLADQLRPFMTELQKLAEGEG